MASVADPRSLYRYSAQAATLPFPEALDEAHIANYHSEGFIGIENVLSPEEVAGAKTALDDLIHGRIPNCDVVQPEPDVKDRWPEMTAEERALTVRKVYRFVSHEPFLMGLTQHPNITRVLDRLMGETSHLIQDMALLKPAFIGTEKPWHQDMAYFGWGPPESLIGVWIALDAATPQNGCMHVLPGTHRAGPVPHFHVRDCQIDDESVQVERDVMVPLAPGGALFFSSLIHHGTPPNNSPDRRRALQYHYAGHSAVKIGRAAHAALYFNGDEYAGCREGMPDE